MAHIQGTLTYKGDVGEDLMGKVMGPGRGGKFFVVTQYAYTGRTDNRTIAELDELMISNQPPVVMMEGTPW